MNDRQLENKVRQDAVRVKKDMNILVGDSTARFGQFESNVSKTALKAKEDLTTWVDDNVTQLSEGVDKMSGDLKETAVSTAATVKKEVEKGLIQYNTKAQEFAEKVSGSFGVKAVQYPWVAISIALAAGFLLGSLLKPARRTLSYL
jgi:ElaB/YqjD/DUF883 family membrane-anchored ribosome-binding protein